MFCSRNKSCVGLIWSRQGGVEGAREENDLGSHSGFVPAHAVNTSLSETPVSCWNLHVILRPGLWTFKDETLHPQVNRATSGHLA